MNDSASSQKLALGPFYREAAWILEHTSHVELIDRLLERARELPCKKRAEFLTLISPDSKWDVSDSSLIFDGLGDLMNDIEAFLSDLRGGKYIAQIRRSKFEPEQQDDTSWIERIDDLIRRANEEFLVGDRGLAAAAFKHLLSAFLLDDGTTFCGEKRATELIKSNLNESKARYCRAIYETCVPHQRALRLLESFKELSHVGDHEIGIRALIDSDIEMFTDIAQFLETWLKTLRASDPTNHRSKKRDHIWNKTHLFLLKEAVELVSGSEGLGQLAEEKGNKHPHFYVNWINALVTETRYEDALEATAIALASVQDLRARAIIADRRADIASICRMSVDALTSRRMAWECEPNTTRLINYFTEQTHTGRSKDERASQMLRSYLRGEQALDGSLSGILELLTGRYNVATRRLSEAPVLGWTNHAHPGPILLPFMIYAGAGVHGFDADARMWLLWKSMEERIENDKYAKHDIGDLLLEALNRHPVPHAMGELFLAVAGEASSKRVRAIVTRQHRKAYRRAAEVLVGTIEAILLSGDLRRGERIINEFRREFPRQRAFQFELKAQLKASPIAKGLLRKR